MRKEIRQSMLVPTRQETVFLGLSNRANFTSPAVARIDSARAHASSGSARSSQSSGYSSQLSTSERDQIVARIDSTRAHASSGSARSSQRSGYSSQLSTSERDQIVQDDDDDEEEEEEEEQADECLQPQPQENKQHLIDTMNTSSGSSQHRAYVPLRPIARKRPTMIQKLSASYNHSKGLAEAERNVPKRRSLLSSDL
jgi:hypothetical protein